MAAVAPDELVGVFKFQASRLTVLHYLPVTILPPGGHGQQS